MRPLIQTRLCDQPHFGTQAQTQTQTQTQAAAAVGTVKQTMTKTCSRLCLLPRRTLPLAPTRSSPRAHAEAQAVHRQSLPLPLSVPRLMMQTRSSCWMQTWPLSTEARRERQAIRSAVTAALSTRTAPTLITRRKRRRKKKKKLSTGARAGEWEGRMTVRTMMMMMMKRALWEEGVDARTCCHALSMAGRGFARSPRRVLKLRAMMALVVMALVMALVPLVAMETRARATPRMA